MMNIDVKEFVAYLVNCLVFGQVPNFTLLFNFLLYMYCP